MAFTMPDATSRDRSCARSHGLDNAEIQSFVLDIIVMLDVHWMTPYVKIGRAVVSLLVLLFARHNFRRAAKELKAYAQLLCCIAECEVPSTDTVVFSMGWIIR